MEDPQMKPEQSVEQPLLDQTAAGLSTQTGRVTEVSLSNRDRKVLRTLAHRVAELANRQCESEKRHLWFQHNALEPTRPVIFCDPENGWNEIISADQLECETTLGRSWEMRLRKEIFWGESMGDDRVVESDFVVSYSYTESDWGMHETKIGGQDGGSYVWDAPLKDYASLDSLRFPAIVVDRARTQAIVNLAGETFGDLLRVQVKGSWWWTLGMTWTLITLRGLEQALLDMYDHPEDLHRLMQFLRDGHLAKLDFLEENGLLSLNNDGTYVGSGGFGYTRELPQEDYDGTHVRTKDMWGFAESQETSTVSSQLFEEFVFQYQVPILERFGLNCYGCCEPLDQRWHVVSRVPHLRRVSVSPWCNLGRMAESLEDNYICSLKPNPADIAVPHMNEERIRRDLRDAIHTTRGCRVEIIMKDNHTIGRNPQNVIRWCAIAQEEAARL